VQAGSAHVLGQKVLDGIAAELSPAYGGKQDVLWPTLLFPQPGPQHYHGFLAQGRTALLTPLTLAPDMRADAENEVSATKAHQF